MDKNDDGIEDDQLADPAFDAARFDMYYDPAYMGPAEQVYNTLDGSMPGFRQKYFYDDIPEYGNTYDLVNTEW